MTSFHTVSFCLYLADPATFLTSNMTLLREQLVYSDMGKYINVYLSLYYDLNYTVNISLPKLHNAPLISDQSFYLVI